MSTGRDISMIVVAHALLGLGWSHTASAETICNYVIQSAEYPVPMDERESLRATQSRVIPDMMSKGDELVRQGQLAQAAYTYHSVFHLSFTELQRYGYERCVPTEVYQRAADKLRPIATKLALQYMDEGHFLDNKSTYDPKSRPGALRLFIVSNQYDAFVEHALDYAEKELLERDIDGELMSLVQNRLTRFEATRNEGNGIGYRNLDNDLTPLLDEELAAFNMLADFDTKLEARLAPLYPKITDHWLAEESKRFKELDKTDGMMQKMMLAGQATDALSAGIDRLNKHPKEIARLKARANSRGEALMQKEQYEYASGYFDIADNQEQYAKADRLAEERQNAMAKEVEAAVMSDIEKMKKTDEEKAEFQEEADDMAAEFGFELED